MSISLSALVISSLQFFSSSHFLLKKSSNWALVIASQWHCKNHWSTYSSLSLSSSVGKELHKKKKRKEKNRFKDIRHSLTCDGRGQWWTHEKDLVLNCYFRILLPFSRDSLYFICVGPSFFIEKCCRDFLGNSWDGLNSHIRIFVIFFSFFCELLKVDFHLIKTLLEHKKSFFIRREYENKARVLFH